MKYSLYEILLKWVTEANCNIDKENFEISLLSHPDYGALNSITDTLNEFGIENAAVQIPLTSISELTEPFITLIKQKQEEKFALIHPAREKRFNVFLNNRKSSTVSMEKMKDIWTGNVVIIDKNEDTRKIRLRMVLLTNPLFLISILLFSIFILLYPYLYPVIYFAMSLSGLMVSSLIIAHQSGYNNSIVSAVCLLGQNTGCETVLNSRASKIASVISLSDAAIIYFVIQVLVALFIRSAYPGVYTLIHLVSFLTVPVILYSLYQQKLIIKKWCPLCLAVIGVLIIQVIISSFTMSQFLPIDVDVRAIILYVLVAVLIIVLWALLNPLFIAKKEVRNLKIEALSFRRNYHLLIPYLDRQPVVSATGHLNTIQIGNPDGSLRLKLITNPQCSSCIELHKVLNKLIYKYPNLSVQVIFYVPLNVNDWRAILAGLFLSHTNEKAVEVMQEWYRNADPEAFIKRFENRNIAKSFKLLEQHIEWCHSNNIYVTPTLIIGDKIFPHFYHAADIEFFLDEACLTSEDKFKGGSSNTVLVDST